MGASALVRLVLCLELVSNASSVWLINESLYKSKNILPVPVEMIPTVAESIGRGAQMALGYCQDIFKWDKWNCPTNSFFRLQRQSPNRETAFSKAVLAAGIVHTITRDCSKGEIEIPECGCNPDLEAPSVTTTLDPAKVNKPQFLYNLTQGKDNHSTDWSWGGCSDDPRYALGVSKKLLENLEKGNDAITYVGRHNYKVGREIIRDSMVKKCRCHGVSSSCSLQTCWLEVPPFGEVARKLREKYKKAERLTYDAVEESVTLGNSARELADEKVIPVKRHNLVYLVQSPDYCVENTTEGLPGTKRRKCSRDTSASNEEKRSCRTLCRECGHRVRKIKKKEATSCRCKFLWCCEVKCETCVVDVEEYFCY